MENELSYPVTVLGTTEEFDGYLKTKIQNVQRHNLLDEEKIIAASEISIVIPVKDNQEGVQRLLDSLFRNTPADLYPKEVIVVDNNSAQALTLENTYPIPVSVIQCGRPGPAAARNKGVKQASGRWILFIDSDCVVTGELIKGYVTEENTCVAYTGMVRLTENDFLTAFYRDQNIMVPPALKSTVDDSLDPCYLVTANSLVLKSVFEKMGGFNESLVSENCGAGGEDTELGFRLRMSGRIKFNWQAAVEHKYDDGLPGFMSRFIRYGFGDKAIEKLYQLDPQSMIPRPPVLNNPKKVNEVLAELSYAAMIWGYEEKPSQEFKSDKKIVGLCDQLELASQS